MVIGSINLRRCFPLAGAILLMIGNASSRADEAATSQSTLNDGYSLLYDFCNQESQLSLLLWVKAMPSSSSDYIKQISAEAKGDLVILRGMGVSDPSLRLNKVSLPAFEINVRQSMTNDLKYQLIWGSFGTAFVQALNMTQSEMTNYGLHVAKVLSETEPNPNRARAIHRMYEQWLKLHMEAYRLNREARNIP